MQNITKNNLIYLSGGGNEQQSLLLDRYFFNKIPENGNFLYIPVALRGTELYPTAKHWMKKLLELHKRIDINFETADDLSCYKYEEVKKFDAIYIGGGNTWGLMQELRELSFDGYLAQYLKDGGQVYGGSAGAIVLGRKIDTHDDENIMNMENAVGFDILKNYSVACHYEDEQSDRFKEWALHNNSPIVCLSEESGLVIEGNSVQCVGTKSCIIYLADGNKKEVQPQDSFEL
jgi:dipeptidase E